MLIMNMDIRHKRTKTELSVPLLACLQAVCVHVSLCSSPVSLNSLGTEQCI